MNSLSVVAEASCVPVGLCAQTDWHTVLGHIPETAGVTPKTYLDVSFAAHGADRVPVRPVAASLLLRTERWFEELDAALDHAYLRCLQEQESVD